MGPEADSKETLRQLPLADTLAAFYASEKFRSFKKNTQSAYQGDLKGLQESWKRDGIESTSQITPQAVADYLSALQRSPATLTRYQSSITTFLSWAEAERLVSNSLVDRLPKRPKLEMRLSLSYLSDEKTRDLIKKARGNLRNLGLVTLAVKTGATLSEIINLNVDDIKSLSEERVSIQFTNRKGKKRLNYLEEEAAEIIRQQAAKQKSGPLFYSEASNNIGERLRRAGLWRIIRELGETIDWPDLNSGILRSTFVRNFRGNPTQLSVRLGITDKHAMRLDARKNRK